MGQGNGAGPQIWALVSTPVLDLLRAEGYGAVFKAVISGQEIHFVGYDFVDDVDLIATAKSSTESFQSVIEQCRAPWTPGLVESESLVAA
jgi:hypothetical protein